MSAFAKCPEATGGAHKTFVAADSRADDRQRAVSLDNGGVMISRRLSGIRMRVRIPASCYRGVVLEPAVSTFGAPSFQLRLDHNDPDLNIPLFEGSDPFDLVQEWGAWSVFFDLPRLLQTRDGALASFDCRATSLVRGRAASDRRNAHSVGKRRPRFLARRKIGTFEIQASGQL